MSATDASADGGAAGAGIARSPTSGPGVAVRYCTAGGQGATVEHRCPWCGHLFEPAGELSGLVGFRVVRGRHASGTPQGLVDRLGALLERRAREQADHDECWEYGGGAIAEAAAPRGPETTR